MPKIGDYSVTVHAEQVDHKINYTINYSKKDQFTIKIPDTFHEVFDSLTREDKMKFGAYGHHHIARNDGWRMVSADTEKGVQKYFKELLEHLTSKVATKRPVIVINFSSHKASDNYQSKEERGVVWKENGLSIDFTYCIELTVAGNDPKYYRFWKDKTFGEEKTLRSEVGLHDGYRGKSIVIPDTKENRKSLEQIYGAMTVLHDKLELILKTPEALLDFVSLGVRLLEVDKS